MRSLVQLTLNLLPWIPAFLCRVTTVEEFTVLEGRSLTVPCHYEPQYASYVKYWCYGRMKDFCTTLARTNDSQSSSAAQKKVSIFDDPVQLVFTVTMNDLKEADSGWHMCGVEIAGIWTADDVAFTNIKVIRGMSVVNSRLSGKEGSSVKVECLYSEKDRNSKKGWCRSGNWSSCLLTSSEGSYEDTLVAISDDRTGTFTVSLKKLRTSDTGWHWCVAGEQKIAVHVLVTPGPTTTASSVTYSPTQHLSVAHPPPPKPRTKECWKSHSHIFESFMVCSALMVLVGLAVLARKRWKLHKRDPWLRRVRGRTARLNNHSGNVDDLKDTAVIFFNKDSEEKCEHRACQYSVA